MSKNVVIVGGHGNIALRLTRLLVSSSHTVTSLIRDPDQASSVRETGAEPLVLSLEDASTAQFTNVLEEKQADIVYFAAGAGAKGGEERTKAVDYEGALKIFDAIEATTKLPRLVLIGAVDVRNVEKIPSHYNDEDLALSKRIQEHLKVYMKYKIEGDINLMRRTKFKWTIVRAGGLTNNPGTGTANIGRVHLGVPVSRDDVAKMMALLIDREDAAGMAIDIVGGPKPIRDALGAAIRDNQTWRLDELL